MAALGQVYLWRSLVYAQMMNKVLFAGASLSNRLQRALPKKPCLLASSQSPAPGSLPPTSKPHLLAPAFATREPLRSRSSALTSWVACCLEQSPRPPLILLHEWAQLLLPLSLKAGAWHPEALTKVCDWAGILDSLLVPFSMTAYAPPPTFEPPALTVQASSWNLQIHHCQGG